MTAVGREEKDGSLAKAQQLQELLPEFSLMVWHWKLQHVKKTQSTPQLACTN